MVASQLQIASTLPLQLQIVTPLKQHTPTAHLVRDQFWVDSWSALGRLQSKMTINDRTP